MIHFMLVSKVTMFYSDGEAGKEGAGSKLFFVSNLEILIIITFHYFQMLFLNFKMKCLPIRNFPVRSMHDNKILCQRKEISSFCELPKGPKMS